MLKPDIFSRNKAMPEFIIYTAPDCPKCQSQKIAWVTEGISFEERDSSRLKNPSDAIDTEGLINAAMQNEVLPVIVERGNLK